MKTIITVCACLCVSLLGLAACQSDKDKAVYTGTTNVSEAEQQMLAVLEQQAEQGSQYAHFQLVFHRDWMKGQYDKAVPTLKKLAEEGSADAAEIVSLAYRNGQGVEQDHGKSIEWLERAASLGSASAQRHLAEYAQYLKEQIEQSEGPSE